MDEQEKEKLRGAIRGGWQEGWVAWRDCPECQGIGVLRFPEYVRDGQRQLAVLCDCVQDLGGLDDRDSEVFPSW